MWVLLGTVTLFGAILGLAFWTRDVQDDPPRLLGSIWTAREGDTTRLYFVMEEKRARRGYFDTRGKYSYSMPYSIFTLHARDARDGAAPAATVVARTDGGSVDRAKQEVSLHLIAEPEILGPQGEILWLWNNGLEARRLGTLEPVWTAARLKELNPGLSASLPADRKYYKVLGKLNALTYKGTDARYFQIDPASGIIQPIDNAVLAGLSPEQFKTADNAFQWLHPESESLWSTSVGGLLWNSLTDDDAGVWYGLLSPDEHVPAHWTHPRYGFGVSGEVSRSLYRANFTIEKSIIYPEGQVAPDPSSASQVSDERFLMGGFLRRPNRDHVWMVDDAIIQPETNQKTDAPRAAAVPKRAKSCLILHRKALGDENPWHVTRLGFDGAVHWTRSTGLADLQHLCDGQASVVFTGFVDRSQPTGKRPDMMVFIDLATGQSRTVNLTTGESGDGR